MSRISNYLMIKFVSWLIESLLENCYKFFFCVLYLGQPVLFLSVRSGNQFRERDCYTVIMIIQYSCHYFSFLMISKMCTVIAKQFHHVYTHSGFSFNQKMSKTIIKIKKKQQNLRETYQRSPKYILKKGVKMKTKQMY